MAYWGKNEDAGTDEKRPVNTIQEKATGGILTKGAVKQLIKSAIPNYNENQFYELEMAEVISVLLDDEELPDKTDGTGKDYSLLGSITARMINSEKDTPVQNTSPIRSLEPREHLYPIRGEYVVVVTYNKQQYYISGINMFGNVNSNVSPGLSGYRPDELIEEDFVYEHFEIDNEIRRLWPYQGDSIYQGRLGNSLRFGSNIIPNSHGDEEAKPNSPNILIRAGQLTDAENFNKSGEVTDLQNSPKKPVKEDINSDGSSVWITTDQSIKLDITETNALNHEYMSSDQEDDQPKEGGKQIVINSDRITFNSKKGRILGFSHNGIGFSTQKSFTVDADDGVAMNSGGGTSMAMVPGGISLVTPGNSRLDLGGGETGDADKITLSSECPSFLILDDKAHLESCDGAIVHLDDCAGMKDNQGSFIRIGGKAQGVTGYVKERDDMGQQHLVYGEALTDILDELITSILNITAIPTGAGPSGPISATPSVADFESIRAKLCDLLMKPN